MSAGTRLARTLEAMARTAGCPMRIAGASERPWASATFVGARHALVVEGTPSQALAAWLDTLPDADFAVPGHVVADVTVDRGADGATIAALTLEA